MQIGLILSLYYIADISSVYIKESSCINYNSCLRYTRLEQVWISGESKLTQFVAFF